MAVEPIISPKNTLNCPGSTPFCLVLPICVQGHITPCSHLVIVFVSILINVHPSFLYIDYHIYVPEPPSFLAYGSFCVLQMVCAWYDKVKTKSMKCMPATHWADPKCVQQHNIEVSTQVKMLPLWKRWWVALSPVNLPQEQCCSDSVPCTSNISKTRMNLFFSVFPPTKMCVLNSVTYISWRHGF